MRLSDLQQRLLELTAPDFERFIFELLQEQPDFVEVRQDMVVGGIQFDIVAQSVDPVLKRRRTWFIEVAHVHTLSTAKLKHEFSKGVMSQQLMAAELSQFILVVSGALTPPARAFASERGITVWDVAHIADMATDGLLESWFKSRLQRPPHRRRRTKADALIEELSAIPPGNADAARYQRFCADALEYLFVPPLESARYEHADEPRRNRRDIILENAAEDGFWAFIRDQYKADYIVVDAKNYSNPIGKRPVLDVAHYLKAYGCGLFGVLLTRHGASAAGEHARREQWIDARKMLAILSDDYSGPQISDHLDRWNGG